MISNPLDLGNLEVHYSSQSATSVFAECKRRYFFNYAMYGTGIVPIYSSIPLTTGGCVHLGTEAIARGANIEQAVEIATQEYNSIVSKHPLAAKGDQQGTINEQIALTEALVRLWYMMEWPKIQQYYTILAVEKEITFPLDTDILYQSRPDLILQHKASGEVVAYSLKTVKMLNERTERSYKVDLQASTEPYAVDYWLSSLHTNLDIAREALLNLNHTTSPLNPNIQNIYNYLTNKISLPERCSLTRFCYLVKGQRWETKKGSGEYWTDNPFIYGYRQFSLSTINYAWCDKVNKPENKSGWGKLGKGWEKFQVWDCSDVGGVAGWMKKLADEDGIQNDLGMEEGNVFEQHILGDGDVWARREIIERRIRQLASEERDIIGRIKTVSAETLDENFPFNTDSCYFPSECPYLNICPNGNDRYKEHIAEDPINPEFGAYEKRVPHHRPEREWMEKNGLIQIQQIQGV